MSKGSLAVAYTMKKKRMASGGTVKSGDKTMNYAEGGEVSPNGDCPSCGQKMMSHGGEVANEQGPGVDSLPNEFDDLALRDGLEFKDTGANSGDEDGGPSKDDLVSRAMMRKKKR